MGAKPNISQEMKENIADDLALGYSYGNIADRYGVSFSTIRRVKKSSEAPTAMENASEEKVDTIDTSIIPDTEENVKPESQLAELEKSDVHYTRIDGQCRTETDSTGQKRTAQDRNGQHRTETDNGGQYSPYVSAVDEAALERRERLLEKISELQSEISYYESEISRLEEFHSKYMEVQSNGT